MRARVEGWRTDDRVFWWVGRGEPSYAPMTEADKTALREQFAANGRLRFLP